MAICNHLANNGEKSILYDALAQKYGPDRAHDYWTAIRSEQFLLHDDWMDDIKDEMNEHLDSNGEPTMSWVEEKLAIPQPKTIEPEKVYSETIKRNLEPDKGMNLGLANRSSEEVMQQKVKVIYNEANSNPDKLYHIDYDYKSDKYRYASGYTARELANIFDSQGATPPNNIRFTEGMQRLINNSSKRILESLPHLPVEVINRDEIAITYLADKILIPKYNEVGKLEGYFSASEQQAIVDSAMYATHSFLLRDPNFGANAIIKTFKAFQAYADRDPSSNWKYVHDQRLRVASEMMDQMSTLGYDIKDINRVRILRALDKLEDIKGIDSKVFDEVNNIHEGDTEELVNDNKEFIEAMGHGLKDWGEVSFEHGPKDTASARMKMFIAMLPDMDRGKYVINEKGISIPRPAGDLEKWARDNPRNLKSLADQVNRKGFWMGDEKSTKQMIDILNREHAILPTKNFLNVPKLVDFEATWQDILETLADSSTHDYDLYKGVLQATGRPNLLNLVKSLDGADQQIRNEFSRLVSMQYTNFSMMLFNKMEDADGTHMVLRNIVSNRYSQRNTILKNWRENQKLSDIMKINEVGQRVIDVDRARNKWIPALSFIQKMDWSQPDNIIKAKKFVSDMLSLSGIHLTDQMVDYLFGVSTDKTTKKVTENMNTLTKGTSLAGGIAKQFSVTQDGQPNGMFSAFIMKMAGVSDVQDINTRIDDKADLESRAEMNNPLYTENTTMQILSRVSAMFTPVLHSGTSKSSEGKDIWDYSMHTKLSHQLIDMKQNYEGFVQKYDGVDIAKNNFLLNALDKIPQYRDRIKLMYMDGMKPQWGKRGTTRASMSDREQMLMSLSLFQNQGNGFNKIPTVHYMSLTHSDKTTTPLMMNMPKVDVGTHFSNPPELVGKIGSMFYNIFKSEHNRIVNQEKTDFNDSRYNKGKSLFFFIPEFNKEHMQDMVKKGFLSDREFKTLWSNGESLTKQIGSEELTVVNKILDKVVNDRVETTLDAWKKNGLITEDSHLFDKKYVSKLLEKNGIKGDNDKTKDISYRKTTYFKNGKELTDAEVHEITVRYAAKDYAVNYFLHNVSMSQLFYGDPAMTFKKGKTDMESVDLTLKEYGKRLAKDIAPGLDPYFRPEDKQFNSITLTDHYQKESYLENLKKIFPNYSRVNATDAQELTTVPEHLKVMYANGVILTKTFNDMMDIVTKAKGGYYEFTNPDHLSVIMQPVKPVYSGQRTAQDGALLEDYIKTSSIPLYPPATSGLELDGLRQYMEKNNLDRAPFESGKKIGSPSTPASFFSSDGKFREPSPEEVKGATVRLDRSGFRIQQEVPYDEDKKSIKTVSQMNKLITEGIESIKDFNIPGHDGTMTGKEVRQLKEDIRKKMIGIQYDDFKRSWGIDDTNRIQDKSVIYDKLLNLSGNDKLTNNERISLSARDADGNLFIPLQYNTAADNLESMLMSMVKDIAQIKMPGKSFVQASSVGWKFTSEKGLDKSGIIWAEDYDGDTLKTTRIENGVVKGAQVLIPFNFQDKDGNVMKAEDYMVMKDGRKIIDTNKIPPELMQLIGARIPNQGHSSMAAMEVVGFLPKNMGDAIVVPAGFTTQMGADFDVDKLYTYRRPYNHNQDENTFSQNKEGMSGHQGDYFDVHWGVLTHPEMAERILKPLDKPDLKEENNVLRLPKSEGYNYFDHMSQLQDFQNGKDAKTLVGLTSLSVTFNSVIQDKKLHFAKDEIKVSPEGKVYTELNRDYVILKDEHDGSTLKLSNLSGNGTSHYTRGDGEAYPGDGTDIRTKADNQSTIQSAAVDNAKDRALDNLNITPHTYPAIDALMQLETEDGKAVNLKYGTRLLTQPIIKEFATEMKKGNDSLSTVYDPDLKNTVSKKLKEKYREMLDFSEDKDMNEEVAKIIFDPQLLKKAQLMEGHEFALHQLAALNLFEKLHAIGERKSQLQSYFNQDTQGAGPNILTALDKSDKMTRLEQAPIKNATDIYVGHDGITEQGYTAQATTGVAVNILTQLLPYDKYSPLFTELAAQSGRPTISIDDQRNVLRSIRSFTYNSGQYWWKDAHVERARLFYSRSDGRDDLSLARRVEEAKRTWGKDNYFLQRLDPVIGDTTTSPDFLEYQAATVGRVDEENNNRAWTEMLMSNDEHVRGMGEDLLRYAFLTGGVQDQNSFVKFAPAAYIANTDFGNMLKEKAENHTTDDSTPSKEMPGFQAQYLQHNPEKAFQIGRETFGDIPSEQNYPESFPVNYETNYQQKLQIGEIGSGELREWLSYRSQSENKWILYHLNPTDTGLTVYTRIDTLGNQYTDEYNGESNGAMRSIFTENRAMAEELPAMSPLGSMYQSMGNDYRGSNHYESLGITEGTGRKHMNQTLDNIKDNEDVPNALRSVASFLRGAANFDIPGIKMNIKFDENMGASGLTKGDGSIHLNPNTSSIAQAAETTLHEYIHNRLSNIIYVSGYDEKTAKMVERFSEVKKRYDERVEDFRKNFPEAVEHIRQLDRIRYEAHEILKARLSKDQIAEAERKLNDINTNSLNHDEALYYSTKTLQEFVPQVMSDKAVQEFVKNIPDKKEGNFLQRIWKGIVDTLLGTSKEKPKDNLREALFHIVGLFGEYKQAGNITDALLKGEQINVPTETSAKGLKSMMKYTYKREMDIRNNGDYFTLTPMANYNTVAAPIGKVTERVKDQLDKAYRDISKGNQSERIQARVRYNEIRQQYNDLLREQNVSMISKIAQIQLEWVNKVLESGTSNAAITQAAIETAHMWGNVTELMYGDSNGLASPDPTLSNLEQQAQLNHIRLINRNAVDVVTKALDGRVVLNPSDMKVDLKDVDAASAYFLTLSRVKPKLISGLGLQMKTGANTRDEHISRVHNQLMNIEKQMKKLGITADHFMQEKGWGLLDRVSNGWHEHVANMESKRENGLDAVAKTEGLTDSIRKQRTNKVWEDYWNDVKKSGAFVDTRIFFDNITGSRKTGPDVDKALKDLGDKVGDHKYAQELLDKAHQKYQDYIDERKVQSDYLDGQIQLSDDEKIGKNHIEQETLRKQRVGEELDRWLKWNSPHEFLNKMTGKGDTKYVNDGSRWVTMAPKFDQGFYDPKWEVMQKDDRIRPVFEEYKSLIQEMTSYLSPEHAENLPSGFLPMVSNETINSLSSTIKQIKNLDSTLMNMYTDTEAEEYARLRPDEIPIMYTRETKYTQDEANRSKDLIRIAQVFANMALHYKYLAPILDEVNVAESIIREANAQRAAGNQEGPTLRNAMNQIKYNKDRLIFNKPNELEGKIDAPIWSANPIKQAKIQKEVKILGEEKNILQQKIRDKQDAGEWDYDKEQERLDAINNKLTELDNEARYIYGSKVVDNVISINQLKALAYNPFSAVANFTFALISAQTYGTGRTDYDPSHLRQAMGIATHAMKNYYTFGAGMDSTARKIRALMERSQVMSEIGIGEIKNSRSPSRVKEALSPFNWQKSGDYFAKGSMMIAMMLKKMVDVTDKQTGEKSQVRLWDALDTEGKWDTEKYMDNSDWYHEDVSQQKEWNVFRDKMRGVSTIVFGNQDKNSPLLAKKYALLRLAGQFRMSWFPEGLNSRFGSERFDPVLGRDVKGRYRSYGTMGIMTSMTIMARSLLDTLPGIHVDRFKGLTDKEGNAIKDVDMENMRRNFAGLAWGVSIAASIILLRALYDDKHKGKKNDSGQMQRQLLINMLIRNQQDLEMYSSPSVWDTVTGNLIPATTVVTDTWKAIKATNHYLFGDTHKDKHATRSWLLKITKATPILNNINKAQYMFNRDLDAIQR